MQVAAWAYDGFAVRCTAVALAVLGAVLMWSVAAIGTEPYETYEATITGDSPVAQFRFDDSFGSSTLVDSVGSYSATSTGITFGGEGPFSGSHSGSFGGSAYATLPSSPLAEAKEFTAEAWVDWSGGTSYEQPIFDFGSSSTNYMYLTPAASSAEHKLTFEIHTTEGGVGQVAAPQLESGSWHYIAVTEDEPGTLRLFVDGAQVGESVETDFNPASLGSMSSSYVGKSLSGARIFTAALAMWRSTPKRCRQKRLRATTTQGSTQSTPWHPRSRARPKSARR